VTPTIAQRVGLAPAQLGRTERRALLASRAAALLFAVQSALALGAAATGHALGAPVVLAAAAGVLFALLILLAYERLPWYVSQLLAFGGGAVVAFLVVTQPHGERYALLFLPPVIYVSFFFRARNALVHLGVVSVLAGASLMAALPSAGAVETWLLVMGALAQAAGTTIALRRHLLRAFDRTRADRALLDAFFASAPGGFAFLDAGLRYVRTNSTFAELLQRPVAEIAGRTVRELAPGHAGVVEPLMRAAIDRGTPITGVEMSSHDGTRHFLASYYPVPGLDGATGVGVAVTDITQLKDVERRLEETNRRLTVLATTDELTGLPNRRMLGEQLDLALARAQRRALAVALLYLDLDGFKEVNDTLGHAYGDELLVEVAARLRAGARATDVVARVGGDEFIVLLADLDVQEAPALAETVVERLRRQLAEPVTVGALELKAAASIGTSIYPLDARDGKALLAAADASMYAGKVELTRVA
jgi:diguanylate cyclase (GGDEF)-like protein